MRSVFARACDPGHRGGDRSGRGFWERRDSFVIARHAVEAKELLRRSREERRIASFAPRPRNDALHRHRERPRKPDSHVVVQARREPWIAWSLAFHARSALREDPGLLWCVFTPVLGEWPFAGTQHSGCGSESRSRLSPLHGSAGVTGWLARSRILTSDGAKWRSRDCALWRRAATCSSGTAAACLLARILR